MAIKVGDLLIDYSYARPNLAAAKAAGAVAVVRYSAGVASDPSHGSHSANSGKLITKAEFDAILANGLDVIANDEWYEGRVTEGAAAGYADGRASAKLWKSVGLARGATIYSSWDEDPVRSKWDAVVEYLRAFWRAAREVGGYKMGTYAGSQFVKYAMNKGVVIHGWRPAAGSWSDDGLPYQPNTSTALKRQILVAQAVKVTPSCVWQDGNYWFGQSADEDLVLRVPVGSHKEQTVKDSVGPKPTPKPDLAMLKIRIDNLARRMERVENKLKLPHNVPPV